MSRRSLTSCDCPTGDRTRAVSAAHQGSIRQVLVAATFVVIRNETVMVTGIPRLMEQFAVSARDAYWPSTAFMLTLAVVIPTRGWLLQRPEPPTGFVAADFRGDPADPARPVIPARPVGANTHAPDQVQDTNAVSTSWDAVRPG
ncbi:MAG: hypothetical protein ABI083_07165 [Lapillicoccus sp.]